MKCDAEYNVVRERLLRQNIRKAKTVKTLIEVTRQLRDDVIALTGDATSMVKWSITPDTPSGKIELEVITLGDVYPFHFDEIDMTDPSIGISVVMMSLRKVFA